jgi:hypothetical protein
MEYLKNADELTNLTKAELGKLARIQAKACNEFILIDAKKSTEELPVFETVDGQVFEAAIGLMVEHKADRNEIQNTNKLAYIVSELTSRIMSKLEKDIESLAKFCIENAKTNEELTALKNSLQLTGVADIMNEVLTEVEEEEVEEQHLDMGIGLPPETTGGTQTQTDNANTANIEARNTAAPVFEQRRRFVRFRSPSPGTAKQPNNSSSRHEQIGRTIDLPTLQISATLDKIPNLKTDQRDNIDEWFTKVEVAAERVRVRVRVRV